MKKLFLPLIFGLTWVVLPAFAADYPVSTPFAQRYPVKSITTEKRAHEVIDVYEEEKKLWEEWRQTQEKACYRNFFVNDCLSGVKQDYNKHVFEARKVWLAARDFLRLQRDKEAKERRQLAEERVQERDKHRQENPPSRRTSKNIDTEVTVNKEQDTRVVPETEQSVSEPPPVVEESKPIESKPMESKPKETIQHRQLTPQQERANEREFARKQEELKRRQAEQEQKMAQEPGKTLEERIAERAQRRAEAEQKRLANIRKRQEKAAEYERQLRLREEQQSNQVLKDLVP